MTEKAMALSGMIDRLIGICEEMLPLVEAERRALSGFDNDLLQQVAKAKNGKINDLYARRSEFKAAVADAALALGPTPVYSIKSLLPMLPPEEEALLARGYLKFQALAQEIDFKNAANQVMIEEGLLAVRELRNAMTGIEYNRAVYHRPGGSIAPQAVPASRRRRVEV